MEYIKYEGDCSEGWVCICVYSGENDHWVGTKAITRSGPCRSRILVMAIA